MKKRILIYGCMTVLLGACKAGKEVPEDEVSTIGLNPCKQQPKFISKTGLNPSRAALSTSERQVMGVSLIEVSNDPNAAYKKWQHPDWNKHGWMGPVVIDEQGNAYVAPIPQISVLDNAKKDQNTVYKIATESGAMTSLVALPVGEKLPGDNPFGLMGLYYDCYNQVLFASSLFASSADEEKGMLYSIDVATGKIIDQLEGYDAIGIASCGVTGSYRLYFGSSRKPVVLSVGLYRDGSFKSDVREEFSLEMLGPRGDDKARRIRIDKDGDMLINGVEFNYNLTAPTEKQETLYRFRFDQGEGKWKRVE